MFWFCLFVVLHHFLRGYMRKNIFTVKKGYGDFTNTSTTATSTITTTTNNYKL